MAPSNPNYKCSNCDGQLEPTRAPNSFKCKQCGHLMHERPRTAKIGTRSDGTVLGAAVFLSRIDLKLLGVNPAKTDRVVYRVVDGTLQLEESGDSDECAK